ncbi:hypothetical protein [Nocardioides pyridinolyticus]
MSASLVVHIGTPKTGSSSLQRTLHDGAGAHGPVWLAYPERLTEADLAHALLRGRDGEVARRLAALAAWLDSTPADVFVLSSEHLVHVPAATFQSALRRHLPEWDARTRIVCYLRPHARRLLSSFAQQRKSGSFGGSLDQYLRLAARGGRGCYADRLADWQTAYGDRLVTRLVSPATLVGGDVVTDFLHVVTGTEVVADGRRLNPALTVEALALLGILHRVLRRRGVAEGVASRVGKQVGTGLAADGGAPPGRRLWLSSAQAVTAAGIFGEDAARLDARFFAAACPMTADLRDVVASAPPEAADLDPARYADVATRKLIRSDAAALADACAVHGPAWLAHYRAAKGYRSAAATADPASAAVVAAAIDVLVARLRSVLGALE